MIELSSTELHRVSRQVNHVYRNDPRVQGDRSSAIGAQLASRLVYDMWHLEQMDPARRKGANALSLISFLAFDILDDIVDGITDADEKLGVYDAATEHLIDGQCRCHGECPEVFQMARAVHGIFMPAGQPSADTYAAIVAAGREQITSPDNLGAQYRAMIAMGSACMRLFLNAGEIVDARTAPTYIHRAVGELGVFAYMQDQALEVHDDLALNIPTYATLRIGQGATVEHVKRDLLAVATRHRERGAASLERFGEKWRYHVLATAMSLKNRL